jgi:TolA-binding protein
MLETIKSLLPSLAFVAWTVLVGLTGRHLGSAQEADRCQARVATQQADTANATRIVVQDALAHLQQAQARGDRLEIRLAEEEEARQIQEKFHADEIKRLTRGRRCLDAPAVRLLNAAPGLPAGPERLPAPASRPVDQDAAAASDTDVALWANAVRQQYDACRSRLAALVDWHQ